MNLRNFVTGLIFMLAGMVLMLFFSVGSSSPSSDVVKWLGVELMIVAPLLFWEIFSLGKEQT